ncbi:MAG: hypothetical protein JO122_10235 [Acetobacteraceae bacterium]|nr:hypothetical protein [Acetobacteraceae bacterium]
MIKLAATRLGRRRTPFVALLRVLLAVPVVLALVVVAFYLILLACSPLLRLKWFSDRTRRVSKAANRHVPSKIAGTRLGMVYFNLSALHHIGRRSGRAYTSPLSAYPLGDGFVLAVAYPEVDWCRNILASGTCRLTWNGTDYELERPEMIPVSQAMKAYPLLVKPFIVAPGTKEFVWLHRADSHVDQSAGVQP